MCRGSSTRRRCLRLLLGVNRKLVVTRWIGETTVGVVTTIRRGLSHVKASEGAEKSFRIRRRRRGQRCGKERSRGRQPRSSVPPPTQNVKEPKVRGMNMHLRACDFWYERQEQFKELFMQSSVYKCGVNRAPLDSYRVWRSRWKTLHNRIVPCGEGVVWCSRIAPSFKYYIEQRFGIVVSFGPRSKANARSDLQEIRDEIRIRNTNPIPYASGNRSHASKFVFRCAFDSSSWTSHLRCARCPRCHRPAVGLGGRSLGRRR
jgi:hypothetical protein